jgi:MFS family permease
LWFVIAYCIEQAAHSTTNGTMQTLGSDMAPKNAIGRFMAVWRTVQQLGSLISPALFALVAQFAGFGSAFLVMVLAAYMVVLIVALMLKETRPSTVTAPVSR